MNKYLEEKRDVLVTNVAKFDHNSTGHERRGGFRDGFEAAMALVDEEIRHVYWHLNNQNTCKYLHGYEFGLGKDAIPCTKCGWIGESVTAEELYKKWWGSDE